MSSYNVKLFEYNGSQQIRKYKRSIKKETPFPVEQIDMEYIDGHYVFKKKRIVDYNKILRAEKKKTIPDVGKIEDEETETERTPEQIEHSIRTSLNRTKNKIYELARSNEWEWFITLTFDPQKVNSKNYEHTKQLVHDWFVKMRRQYAPDLKYLIVPELHADGKKYHFHGVLANIGKIPMIFSGLTTSKEKPIYNIGTFHYGFTTATKVEDTHRVASYITKYITKELCIQTENRRRYLNSENCNRPTVREYCMTDEDFEQILCDLSENITHMKSVCIPQSANKVDYIEVTDI